MQRSNPFARAMAMMAAITDIMAMAPSVQKSMLSQIGPYESRGKGGKRAHRSIGTKANARAAAKSRNVRRARAASR